MVSISTISWVETSEKGDWRWGSDRDGQRQHADPHQGQVRHLVPFLRRRFRPHDEGFAPRVQRGLLDPPRVLTYSPYHCRFGRKRGNIVGRRRDEVSLFELLRDSERSQPSDPAEGTSGEVAEEAVSANQDSSATHGSRRKVALDDRAKKIPVVRRLAPISDSITSASSGDSGADSSAYRSFLSEVVEIRIATILVFSIATLIAIAVAFIAGREFAVVSPPAGMNEMLGAAPPWPVLDPEPELRPAIRNVKQDGVVAAADTGEIVEGTPVNPGGGGSAAADALVCDDWSAPEQGSAGDRSTGSVCRFRFVFLAGASSCQYFPRW